MNEQYVLNLYDHALKYLKGLAEKEGKEWFADTLPEAFEEAKELIEKAKERKGYK